MAEKDQIGSRSVRMTSEEIIQRGFSTKVRGLSETEVRTYLRRVGEEVDRLAKREDELTARVSQLQQELKSKPNATKAELLEILGEQTTRVLSSAEQAAEQMVSEAEAEVEKMLSEAKQQSEHMVSHAKAQADQAIEDAQSRVKNLQESSKRDSITVIEEARIHGREIFQESVVVREQILKDLLRRRSLLLEQIEELRNGREELLESYKVVKGSFQKATDALQGVEMKASNDLMENPIDVDELLKTPVELPNILDSTEPIPQNTYPHPSAQDNTQQEVQKEQVKQSADISKESKPVESVKVQPRIQIQDTDEKRKGLRNYMKDALGVGAEVTDASKEKVVPATTKKIDDIALEEQTPSVKTVPKQKDVNALFQSIKNHDTTEEKEKSISEKTEKNKRSSKVDETVVTEKAESKPKKTAKKKSVKKDPIAVRDEVLNDITSSVLRKAKRQLQDEQNELLEALRTVKPKKRVAAENLIPDLATQTKVWLEVIREELDQVFAAGVKTVSSQRVNYDEESVKSATSWVVTPLREVITTAIDQGEQADATTRVGARYREWRNSDLKNALFDALSCAYNQGIIAAAKDSTMSWNVTKAGQCPDCDDNALEPTANGEPFPTGQVYPPAHSGCRCVLTVA